MYVEPRTNGLHVTCNLCRGAMRAEEGKSMEPENGHWMWWRCLLNPRHVTRAIPLPVQMCRS